MRDDEGLAIAEPSGRPAQVLKDRFTQEWNIGGAVRVAELRHLDPPEIVLLTTEPVIHRLGKTNLLTMTRARRKFDLFRPSGSTDSSRKVGLHK